MARLSPAEIQAAAAQLNALKIPGTAARAKLYLHSSALIGLAGAAVFLAVSAEGPNSAPTGLGFAPASGTAIVFLIIGGASRAKGRRRYATALSKHEANRRVLALTVEDYFASVAGAVSVRKCPFCGEQVKAREEMPARAMK